MNRLEIFLSAYCALWLVVGPRGTTAVRSILILSNLKNRRHWKIVRWTRVNVFGSDKVNVGFGFLGGILSLGKTSAHFKSSKGCQPFGVQTFNNQQGVSKKGRRMKGHNNALSKIAWALCCVWEDARKWRFYERIKAGSSSYIRPKPQISEVVDCLIQNNRTYNVLLSTPRSTGTTRWSPTLF